VLPGIRPESAQVTELRERVRRVLASSTSHAALTQHDEDEVYDAGLYQALAQEGLIRLETVPGGRGPSHVSQTTVLEELGAGATSVAVSIVVQYMGVELLHRYGNEEQQRAYLEPLLAGQARMSFCLSEPGGGTDVARAMRTTATRLPGGGYRLDGAKKWIGGASTADFLIVLARTSDEHRAAIDGITMFVVPRSTPGISSTPIDTMGIRALEQADLVFDDVRIGEDAVLGEPERGFRHVLATLNGERLNGAAVALGIARGALSHAVGHAGSRQAFGRDIGAFQALQHALVDASLRVESAGLLLANAAEQSDAATGGANETLSALAKLAASEAATTVTDTGMRVMGGWGFLRQGAMQRYFRDARLYTFAPLTDEMIRNAIGEKHLGLPRSY
jgi:alkylation response protein AidB-like acyl-CoA dehydrogenase